MVSGVAPTKSDLPVGKRDQSMVGNGDTVGVAAEILEHILGAAEGWLGVDHPVFAKQRSQPGGEESGLRERRQIPGKVQLARDLEQEYPFDPDAPSGAPQVLRTGKSEVISHIDDELLEAVSPDPRILQILRELGLRSSMVVPMLARGRTLGTITFIAAESGRHYDGDDLALGAANLESVGLEFFAKGCCPL